MISSLSVAKAYIPLGAAFWIVKYMKVLGGREKLVYFWSG